MTVTSPMDGTGPPDHALVGAEAGPADDAFVGSTGGFVGGSIGDVVGGSAGAAVGGLGGSSVGGSVGSSVGEAVGDAVGEAVGEAVGDAQVRARIAAGAPPVAEEPVGDLHAVEPEVVAQYAFVRRAQERRRQRLDRMAAVAGLAAAAGLTVLALLTARTPSSSGAQPVTVPSGSSATQSGGPAVGTAGLAPSIEPPPTSPATAPGGS